jgi:hypothetical protein
LTESDIDGRRDRSGGSSAFVHGYSTTDGRLCVVMGGGLGIGAEGATSRAAGGNGAAAPTYWGNSGALTCEGTDPLIFGGARRLLGLDGSFPWWPMIMARTGNIMQYTTLQTSEVRRERWRGRTTHAG